MSSAEANVLLSSHLEASIHYLTIEILQAVHKLQRKNCTCLYLYTIWILSAQDSGFDTSLGLWNYTLYHTRQDQLLRRALLVEGLLGAIVLVARTVLVLAIAVSLSVSTVATRTLAGLFLRTVVARSGTAETQALSHMVENINAVVHSAEELLAGTLSEDRHVSQRVHTLVGASRQSAVGHEAVDIVGRVDEVVIAGEAGDVPGGSARTIAVDLVVLTNVGVGTEALCQSVARVPVGREERVSIAEVAGTGVLALAGLLVDTDSVALGAVVSLGVAILGVVVAENVEAVTVVSSDNDESVLELADLLKVLHGSLDGVIKLEEFAQSAVIVKRVHLLVNGRSLRHEEPTLVTVGLGTSVKNVDGLEGHLLEARLVESIIATAVGAVLRSDQVVSVDVPVEPLLHVAGGEDTKSALGVGGSLELSVVGDKRVACLGEDVVVVQVLVSLAAELRAAELLSTT
jgi:hypothetical protein